MNEEPATPPASVVDPLVSPPPKRRKSKMQLIIVLTVVFLMLIAVGLWWYFIYNKPAEEQPAQSQADTAVQPIANVPEHFVQLGNTVGYIDENGDFKEFVTVAETERIVEAVVLDGKPELRYVASKATGNGGQELTAYGKIDQTGKTELFKLPAGTDAYYSNPILSPDGSTIVVEKSDPETGQMVELTAITVADGTARKVYDPSTRGGLYVTVDWDKDGKLILQSQTCRQCDGPRLAELTKLNLGDGKIASFYKGGAGLGFAQFMRMPGSEEVLMFGGEHTLGIEPGTELDPYSGFRISKITGSATKVIDLQENEYAELAGWTGDEQGLFISHIGVVKTDQANADYQSTDGNYNNLPPKIWMAKGGSKTDVAFNTDLIAKNTQINRVFEQGEHTFVLHTASLDSSGTSYTARLLRKQGSAGAVETLQEKQTQGERAGVFATGIQ